MAYLMSGVNQLPGNSPNGSPSVGVYGGSDAPFYIACANDRLYRRLVVEVLNRPDLVSGEFGDRRSRTANRDKLRAILSEVFATDTRENWVAKMKAANVPVGYLRTVEEGFNSPEARERHRVSEISHPKAGTVPNIEFPAQPLVDAGHRSRRCPLAGPAHERGAARYARLRRGANCRVGRRRGVRKGVGPGRLIAVPNRRE